MVLEYDILHDSLICLWFASVFGLFTAESFHIINQFKVPVNQPVQRDLPRFR